MNHVTSFVKTEEHQDEYGDDRTWGDPSERKVTQAEIAMQTNQEVRAETQERC